MYLLIIKNNNLEGNLYGENMQDIFLQDFYKVKNHNNKIEILACCELNNENKIIPLFNQNNDYELINNIYNYFKPFDKTNEIHNNDIINIKNLLF